MHTENIESIDCKLLLKQIPKKLGIDFLPTLFSKMSSQSALLFHTWKIVESVLLEGKLHRLTKEMVFVVTANVKKCHYCSSSHKAFARTLGLSKELVECLDRDLRYIEPESTRHLLEFAKSLASDIEFDSETKYKRLLEEGFSVEELQELITAVSVASMLSTMANGLQLNRVVDDGFKRILEA